MNNTQLDTTYFFPKVVQAVPTNDFKVFAYFNDGSIHCVNVKPLIVNGTVFEPLKDIKMFKSKLAVINDTVAWDMGGNRDTYKCVDLDPETIFNTPSVDEKEVLKLFEKQ